MTQRYSEISSREKRGILGYFFSCGPFLVDPTGDPAGSAHYFRRSEEMELR